MAEGGPPDCETQKSEICNLLKQSLKKGDTWYLTDIKWFKQWKKFVGYDTWDTSNVGDASANPGPIDNSALIKDDGHLKEHLVDDLDYTLFPKEAWGKLLSWYGVAEGQRPIARKVIEQGMFVKHCKVEVYLLDLKLSPNSDHDKFVTRQFSRADTIADLEKVMRKEYSVPDEKEVRLWNRYMSSTYEHLNKPENTLQDAGLYQGQVIVIEVKNNGGSWPKALVATNTDPSRSPRKDQPSQLGAHSTPKHNDNSSRQGTRMMKKLKGSFIGLPKMAEGGPPDCETQKSEITNLLNQSLRKGDTWYLVDIKWFKQWKKFVGYDTLDTSNVGDASANPGPIDNSALLKGNRHLKEHLVDDLDYTLFPEEAWGKLLSWYGVVEGQSPISRKVIEQGMFVKHSKVEVYLLDLKLTPNSDHNKFVTRQFSRADTIGLTTSVFTVILNLLMAKAHNLNYWRGSDTSGLTGETIARFVIEVGMYVKQLRVEVYPYNVTLSKFGQESKDKSVSREMSRASTLADLEKVMRKAYRIPDEKEVRLWNRYMSSTYEHLNKPDDTLQDAGLYQGQVVVIEVKNDDGSWPRAAGARKTSMGDPFTLPAAGARKTSMGDPFTLPECRICMEKSELYAFVPCGHTSCKQCATNLVICHMCRKPISKIMKIYLD